MLYVIFRALRGQRSYMQPDTPATLDHFDAQNDAFVPISPEQIRADSISLFCVFCKTGSSNGLGLSML
jgi:hypothetical protein